MVNILSGGQSIDIRLAPDWYDLFQCLLLEAGEYQDNIPPGPAEPGIQAARDSARGKT